jgi:hypothetical protein
MRATRTTVALTAAMISFGTTQAAAAPAGQPGEEILTFLDISRQVAAHDVGEGSSQPQPGDVLVFDNLLRHPDRSDAATRQALGRFTSTCTLQEGTSARCEGRLRLRDGTVDVAATPDLDGSPIDVVVTGGTGRYAGVSGSARLTPIDVPGTSRLVVRLTRG